MHPPVRRRLPSGAVPDSAPVAPNSLIWRPAWYLIEGIRMTEVHISMPPALRRALDLLIDPPMNPDVSKGYLDLLSTSSDEDDALPKNTGPIQAAWASPIGSLLYDHAQAISRRVISAWQHR